MQEVLNSSNEKTQFFEEIQIVHCERCKKLPSIEFDAFAIDGGGILIFHPSCGIIIKSDNFNDLLYKWNIAIRIMNRKFKEEHHHAIQSNENENAKAEEDEAGKGNDGNPAV